MWPGDPGPGRLADPMPPSVTRPPAVESNEAGGNFFLFSKDPFSALLSVSFDAKERSFDNSNPCPGLILKGNPMSGIEYENII